MTHGTAVLHLLATALLWSTGGLLIKWVPWEPMAVAGGRSLVASLFLLCLIVKRDLTFSLAQVGGALAYAATVILFVFGNKWTSAANVILLQYTAPVYVALLGWFFLDERVGWKDWLTIGLVLGGMGLFFMEKLTPGNLAGNLCGVASGLTFGCLIFFLRAQKAGSPVESVILGNLLTGLVGLPFVVHAPFTLPAVGGILFLGIFQLGLSYLFFTRAIRHVTALEGILIPVLEPLLNPLWVFLLMGERPGGWALLGGAVILASVTLRYAAQSSR